MCAREHQILQSLGYSTEGAFATFPVPGENRARNPNSNLKAHSPSYEVHLAKSDVSDMSASSGREPDGSAVGTSIRNGNFSAPVSSQASLISNFGFEDAWLTDGNLSPSLQVYMPLPDFAFINPVESLKISPVASYFQLEETYFQESTNSMGTMTQGFTQIPELDFTNPGPAADRGYQQQYHEPFGTSFV